MTLESMLIIFGISLCCACFFTFLLFAIIEDEDGDED